MNEKEQTTTKKTKNKNKTTKKTKNKNKNEKGRVEIE
jgi:hypothetical protein